MAGWSSEGFGALWVPDFRGPTGTVQRLDPATHRVTARFRVGQAPIAAVPGFGSLWVSVTSDGTLARLDPITGRVQARTAVPGAGPAGVLVTPTAVWVASYAGNSISEVDPGSDRVLGTVALPGPAENAVLVGSDIWVTASGGTITEIRPTQP